MIYNLLHRPTLTSFAAELIEDCERVKVVAPSSTKLVKTC